MSATETTASGAYRQESMMLPNRIWSIAEQVVECPTTGMRLDFSSVHTEAIRNEEEPPVHDNCIMLRLWTTDRSRIAVMYFDRNGQHLRTEVEAQDESSRPPHPEQLHGEAPSAI